MIMFIFTLFYVKEINVYKKADTIVANILTNATEYKDSLIYNPTRIVIDLPNTVCLCNKENFINLPPLISVRASQYKYTPLITRLVFDIQDGYDYTIERINYIIVKIFTKKITEEKIVKEKKEEHIIFVPKEKIEEKEEVINVGDVITVSVLEVDAIGERDYFIPEDGTIFLPLAGKIKAVDFTTKELENNIEKSLLPYVKEPQVLVAIKEPAKNKVSVFGEVNSPGVYRFKSGYTIAEAISLAGGVTKYANIEHIILKREEKEKPMNIKEAQEVLLSPFDVVYIPKLKGVMVIGEVKSPGMHPATASSVSLREIIASADGVTPNADMKKIEIISNGNKKIVNIEKGEDTILKPGDMVIVHKKSRFWYNLIHYSVYYGLPIASFALTLYIYFRR